MLTADLPRLPLACLPRGASFTTLGGHHRVFIDTALFACAIEPKMTDAEVRSYEQHEDEMPV